MPTLNRRLMCETLVLLLSATIAQLTLAAATEAQSQAGTLIEELRDATRNGQEGERNSVIERLSEEGINALPVVYEEMKTADVPLRMNLVHIVRRMTGDEATEALLRFALEDPSPEVSRMAARSTGLELIPEGVLLCGFCTGRPGSETDVRDDCRRRHTKVADGGFGYGER